MNETVFVRVEEPVRTVQ